MARVIVINRDTFQVFYSYNQIRNINIAENSLLYKRHLGLLRKVCINRC